MPRNYNLFPRKRGEKTHKGYKKNFTATRRERNVLGNFTRDSKRGGLR